MRRRIASLLLLVFVVTPVGAERTFEAEREYLHTQAFLYKKDGGSMIIPILLDRESLELDICGYFPSQDVFHCGIEPRFTIEGVSPHGQDIPISAAEAYAQFALDLYNEQERRIVLLCETGQSDPEEIAAKLHDIYDSILEMNIGYYDEVVSELSEADSQRVEAYNLQLAGVARPTIVKTGREIDLELASRYPEEYLEDYVANCIESIENKGLPFKRFKSVPTEVNCISTATAYEADGTQVHESYVSMGDDCGIKTYTAQKPERPIDVELATD